jgi:hypothetical protein
MALADGWRHPNKKVFRPPVIKALLPAKFRRARQFLPFYQPCHFKLILY